MSYYIYMIYDLISPNEHKEINNLIQKYDKKVNEFEASLFLFEFE